MNGCGKVYCKLAHDAVKKRRQVNKENNRGRGPSPVHGTVMIGSYSALINESE